MTKLTLRLTLSSFPIVTLALISADIVIFIHEASLGDSLHAFIQTYGLTPAKVFSFSSDIGFYERLYPFVSSMFIHGDWMHIIANVIFLYIFGCNVEVAMGHVKFLVFYLLCGIAAALFHVLTNLGSIIPMLGASGAISGVLGAYITYFPISEFKNPIRIFFFKNIPYIPAAAIIFLWLVIQFLSGIDKLDRPVDSGGVAFWAHVGGFVAGLILARFFHKNKYDFNQRSRRYYH